MPTGSLSRATRPSRCSTERTASPINQPVVIIMESTPLTTMQRVQRRMEAMREEQQLKPLAPALPAPSVIQFDGREFVDIPELHGMTAASYALALQALRATMQVFMQRRFGMDSLGSGSHFSLCDAPVLLSNYLEVDSLVRGFTQLPETVRLYLLENVLGEWGFHFNGKVFSLPNQHALKRILQDGSKVTAQYISPVTEAAVVPTRFPGKDRRN